MVTLTVFPTLFPFRNHWLTRWKAAGDCAGGGCLVCWEQTKEVSPWRKRRPWAAAFRRAGKPPGSAKRLWGSGWGYPGRRSARWEADAAVPELEKLIAMSRLFGVTVGALLGVEPPAGEAAPAR